MTDRQFYNNREQIVSAMIGSFLLLLKLEIGFWDVKINELFLKELKLLSNIIAAVCEQDMLSKATFILLVCRYAVRLLQYSSPYKFEWRTKPWRYALLIDGLKLGSKTQTLCKCAQLQVYLCCIKYYIYTVGLTTIVVAVVDFSFLSICLCIRSCESVCFHINEI
uniref:Uncharacterized protein n=1 Tax=Glossina brevipalpis TaxID=37001 RepID=A0A1A9WXM7_9MUSC